MSEPNPEALTVELVLEAIYIDNGEIVRHLDSPKLFHISDHIKMGAWEFKGLKGARFLWPLNSEPALGYATSGDMKLVWCTTKEKAINHIKADKCPSKD